MRWCRATHDFARGVFYAACLRLAEICNNAIREAKDKPPLMEKAEAEEIVKSNAAAEGNRIPEGRALEIKIQEVQMDAIDVLVVTNCHRILAFIGNDLLSTKGKQYPFWFRKFADDHRLCEPVEVRALDQGNHINFLNGVYDPDTMHFGPHNKNLLITRQAPVEYEHWKDEFEEDWLMRRWLNNINQADRLFVQCYLGHYISGINIEKVFLTVTGKKDTGKSSVSQAIFSTFGKDTEDGYIHAAQLKSFRKSTYVSPGQPRPDIVSMLDSRLTIVPETEGVEVSAEALKLLLSGGADYTGERDLFVSSSSGVNRSGLMFVGNSMPYFDHSDEALTDRHFAVDLSYLKKEDIQTDFNDFIKSDPNFRKIFASWVIQGYEIYRSSPQGFRGMGATIVPLAGMQVKSSSRITRNIVHEWATNFITYSDDHPILKPKDLMESFNYYRRNQGMRPIRMGNFYGNLEVYLSEINKTRTYVTYDRKTSRLKGVILRR